MAKDYPYIWAWGKSIGSFDYYIQGQIELAEADNAPQNAIFKRSDDTWATVDEIVNDELRNEIEVVANEV